MKILFVHQNFPGQYRQLAAYLGASGKHQVVFITQRTNATLPGVKTVVYKPHRAVTKDLHRYLTDVEAGVLNAQAVARVALQLKEAGFVPDVMLGHNGWGEIWYLKDVFPSTPLLGYFEFFYHYRGADVGFNPEETVLFDSALRLRTKNIGNLLALDAADLGQCPTQWQKSQYPQRYHEMLRVVHEGIDTGVVRPKQQARLKLPGGNELGRDDEVVTYAARNLEPYRGFPQFMRSLPLIMQRRPEAQIVILGGDEISYGQPLPNGKTFRQEMLEEVGSSLDLSRVHFLGKVPYATFLTVLQLSRVHVYLTYPFVLSWSMLEAMSAGCLLIASKTPPVEEVVRNGENGIVVDFFSPREIAERAIDALGDPNSFDRIRQQARQTIVDRYDLTGVCLPAQLQMVEQLAGAGR